jgi:hypothetical protein
MDLSAVLAAVFFVATVVLSVVLASKLSRKKSPVWALNTRKIIGIGTDSPSELKMTFHGLSINDVYRTVFIFFNKGAETIRKADVAEAVAIHFEGAKILDQPTALATSKQVNKLSVTRVIKDGDEAVQVDFLYLDHNDGVMVEVLHTKSERIRCSGVIMGAHDIRYIGEFLQRPAPYWLTIMTAALCVLVGYVVYLMWHDVRNTLATHPKYWLIIPIVATLFIVGYWVHSMVARLPLVYRYLRFPRWTGLRKPP